MTLKRIGFFCSSFPVKPQHTHSSSIDMYNNDVGQESAQKFMKQTGDLKVYYSLCDVRRPFASGAPGGVLYGTELGSVTLKRVGLFCFPIEHSTHTHIPLLVDTRACGVSR